ncbi:major facilitator superfamily domain-containing protein [Immersiella caudata]|uniref:Major facilitator superfamily domain-containing protein n=1 Tax=Immersiella caudata TaxID=314043 RepID=A0AA40C304_9PEZI|nr:major facilitator superfamily domain-containing protein [Immersiella caudata]
MSTATSTIELHHFPLLPPVDGGKDAWLFLAACFTIEALVWGFPFAFGVFQSYYSTHEPFAGAPNIPIIGTCAMGIMYISAPLVMFMLQRFPIQGRWSPIFGLLVMCLSLALSSFSTTVTQLIATQGVLYALGGSIAYSPCIIYLDEWFTRRKGLAYGVMWSGTGLAGVILPLLLESLLTTHGHRTTLRIFASLIFVCTAPLVYFVRPRLPIPQHSTTKPFSFSFLTTPRFLLYQLFNSLEAIGFFLPGIYLPSYASSVLGAANFPSALSVLLLNVASVFGCVAMGSLIDRLHVTTCILLSTAGATLGTFLLWGFSSNLAVLYVFAVVYGLFAGSFTSAWPGIMREITSVSGSGRDGERKADPSMVFAFLALGRGVGNVVSGPLSEALVKRYPWRGEAFSGYGSGYGGLIAFTGVTALCGGGSFVWRRLGWL